MLEDEGLFQDFIEESKEHLDGIESDLLQIEEDGDDINPDLVNKTFRAIHSIKGGAGFLGLESIKELTHVQENILNQIRAKEIFPSSDLMGKLLQTIDVLNKMIDDPKNSNEVDVTDWIALIEGALARAKGEEAPEASEAVETFEEDSPEEASPACEGNEALTPEAIEYAKSTGSYLYRAELHPCDDLQDISFKDFLDSLSLTGKIIECDPDFEALQKDAEAPPEKIKMLYASVVEPEIIENVLFTPQERCKVIPFLQAEEAAKAPSPAKKEEKKPAKAPLKSKQEALPIPEDASKVPQAPPIDSSIRVNLKTLNDLMTYAGELVIVRNQMVQTMKQEVENTMGGAVQRLDAITTDLQLAIMATRMQPIGKVFTKFNRVVRDLAHQLKKKIRLDIQGQDVELDKTIIEKIGDPLTHLVRNSVDHGIEMPGERVKAGKNEEGVIHLKAYHEAGQVIIEIVDDGKGIDPEKIKKKALESGNFQENTLNQMSQKEIQKLIFAPGFSTAEQVTDISGRGVGMDVVLTNFTNLGGVVDLDSKVGEGSKVKVNLPLTLAIMPSLLVSLEKEVYAIPQINLVELVRIQPAQIKDRIRKVGNAPVMKLRGTLLPLLHLCEVLEIDEKTYVNPLTEERHSERRAPLYDRRAEAHLNAEEEEDDHEFSEKREQKRDRRLEPCSAINVVVVTAGDFRYGIVVDKFLDSEEIVVKPLDDYLKDCKSYAGATIQGNGRVALILDIQGISQSKKLSSHDSKKLEELDRHNTKDQDFEEQSYLIVQNASDEHFAIPLALITRIEDVESGKVHETAGRKNMQYRGGNLPIFSIEDVARVKPRTEGKKCNVLVFKMGEREVGLVVSKIVDIITCSLNIDDTTFKQPGIMGSSIIFDNTTLLVDIFEIVTTCAPELAEKYMFSAEETGGDVQVLVVDDSKFYRKHISDFLTEAGVQVVLAEDGIDALKKLEENSINIIFTDIEMPNMDGFGFTEKVRADERFKHLPVIAVTSLAGQENEKRGKTAGVDKYLIKLDKEEIIETLKNYLEKMKAGSPA